MINNNNNNNQNPYQEEKYQQVHQQTHHQQEDLEQKGRGTLFSSSCLNKEDIEENVLTLVKDSNSHQKLSDQKISQEKPPSTHLIQSPTMSNQNQKNLIALDLKNLNSNNNSNDYNNNKLVSQKQQSLNQKYLNIQSQYNTSKKGSQILLQFEEDEDNNNAEHQKNSSRIHINSNNNINNSQNKSRFNDTEQTGLFKSNNKKTPRQEFVSNDASPNSQRKMLPTNASKIADKSQIQGVRLNLQLQSQDSSNIGGGGLFQSANSQNTGQNTYKNASSVIKQKTKNFKKKMTVRKDSSNEQGAVGSQRNSRHNSILKEKKNAKAGVGLAFQKAKEIQLMQKIKRIWTSYYHDTELYRFSILKDNHYRTINDLATQEVYIAKKLSIQEKLDQLQKKLGIFQKIILTIFQFRPFHPNDKLVSFLQVIESIFIIVLFFTYTWYIFFDFNNIPFQMAENIVGVCIFFFSFLVRINTSYFQGGLLIEDRMKIITNQKKYFIYDLCAFWAVIYNISNINSTDLVDKLFVFPIFAKTATLVDGVEAIISRLNISGNAVYIYEMIKLLAQAVMLCHLIGTAYYLLGLLELHVLDDETNWITTLGLIDKPWNEKYMNSFYWAQATIMLVGSKGETFYETCFCCFTLFMTVGYFAVILSSIAGILDDISLKNKEYKKDQEIINTFFNEQSNPDMPPDLQGRMLNYLKFNFIGHQDQKKTEQFDHLMTKFPQNLQSIINTARFAKEIEKIKVLKDNFSEEALEQLIEEVKQEFYLPKQIIFQKGVYQSPKIYLILKGEVEIFQEFEDLTHTTLFKLQEGQYFGEHQFFSNTEPVHSAKSNGFLTLLAIPRELFLKYIGDQEFLYDYSDQVLSEDFQNFHMYKDQLILEGICPALKPNCSICNSTSHQSSHQCNLIYFNPNMINLKMKHVYSVPVIQRQEKKRRNKYNFCVYQNMERISDCVDQIKFKAELRIYLKEIQEKLNAYEELHKEEFLIEREGNENDQSESSDDSSDYFSDGNQSFSSIHESQEIFSATKKRDQLDTIESANIKQNPPINLLSSEHQQQQNKSDFNNKDEIENYIKSEYPEYQQSDRQQNNRIAQVQKQEMGDSENVSLQMTNNEIIVEPSAQQIMYTGQIENQMEKVQYSMQNQNALVKQVDNECEGEFIQKNQEEKQQQKQETQEQDIFIQQQLSPNSAKNLNQMYSTNEQGDLEPIDSPNNSSIGVNILQKEQMLGQLFQQMVQLMHKGGHPIQDQQGQQGLQSLQNSQRSIKIQKNISQKSNAKIGYQQSNVSTISLDIASQRSDKRQKTALNSNRNLNSKNQFFKQYNQKGSNTQEITQQKLQNITVNGENNSVKPKSSFNNGNTKTQNSKQFGIKGKGKLTNNTKKSIKTADGYSGDFAQVNKFSQQSLMLPQQLQNNSQLGQNPGNTTTNTNNNMGASRQQQQGMSISKKSVKQQQQNAHTTLLNPNFENIYQNLQMEQSVSALLNEPDEHDEDDIFCACPQCLQNESFFWEFESVKKYLTYFPFNNWSFIKIKYFKIQEKQLKKQKYEKKMTFKKLKHQETRKLQKRESGQQNSNLSTPKTFKVMQGYNQEDEIKI